jgi:hypothetical protein
LKCLRCDKVCPYVAEQEGILRSVCREFLGYDWQFWELNLPKKEGNYLNCNRCQFYPLCVAKNLAAPFYLKEDKSQIYGRKYKNYFYNLVGRNIILTLRYDKFRKYRVENGSFRKLVNEEVCKLYNLKDVNECLFCTKNLFKKDEENGKR